MIEYVKGDILASDAQALVNTVNLEGVMGKGIALQFKRKFDFLMPSYTAALQRGDLAIGRVQVIPFDDAGQQRFIINFPTKDRWRKKSQCDISPRVCRIYDNNSWRIAWIQWRYHRWGVETVA
ncbi:MAG: macro domain-containing protein [Bacteroidota bacterium]